MRHTKWRSEMQSASIVAAPEPKEKQINSSIGDINRKNDEWHLEYPHSKAFAALFYTLLLKNTWNKTMRYTWLLLHPRRDAHRAVLPPSPAERGI
jgi:hypothetical protein